MVYLIITYNSNFTYFIPILGLYVAVSFKLLPALNRIIVTTQKFKRSIASMEKIENELSNYRKNELLINDIISENNILPLNFEKNIIFNNISFKYSNMNNYVLEDLNLNIKKGEIVGIVGQSGEGKSTLVNILCGFVVPNSGHVLVDGIDIRENTRGWRMLLGYVPQTTYLFNETIRSNVSFFSDEGKVNEKKVDISLKAAQLESLIANTPLGKDSIVGERGILLSGGQIQRIALARTIYKDPEVLIFDEATSSLDSENEKKILESIKLFKGKKTLIIVSHRESTLSFCDKIYKVHNQKCTQVVIDKI